MFSIVKIRERKNQNKNKISKKKNINSLDGITRHIRGLPVNDLNQNYPIITKMMYKLKEKNEKNNNEENSNELIENKNKNPKNLKLNRANAIDIFYFQEKLKKTKHKSPKEIHLIINKKRNIYDNEEIIQFLYNLNPFSTYLFDFFSNAEEEIIRKIVYDYNSEIIPNNTIIFKYGDEGDKFYIIHEGKVDLLFPFTEYVEMNKDEYFVYLLRLKRFNEIEMLNNVLLMNDSVYMDNLEDYYRFDDWILKAFNTYLKLQYDPNFIKENIQKKKNKIIKNNSNVKEIKNTKDNIIKNDLIEEHKFFEDQKMKELISRISGEIILTVKLVFPELYKEIQIDDKLLNKREILNLDLTKDSILKVKTEDYINRIKPPILETGEKRKKIIVLKYLYIRTIGKGEFFGDMINDNNHLFSEEQLFLIKKSPFHLKLHQFIFFRTMTAITNNEKLNYIGYINKKCYFENLKKFCDNFNKEKITFLLDNFLFNKTSYPNLIQTYSFCFNEMKIKENDILLSQNMKINNNQRNIYFIKNGQFQLKCYRSIKQIDKFLSNLGHIKKQEIIPKYLKELIETPCYHNIIKQKFNMKLGYVSQNDIIGLYEIYDDDFYFNDYICTSKTADLYYVNYKILKLLINSDINIRKREKLIFSNKFNLLSKSLLNHKFIFLSCFFQKEQSKYIKITPKNNKNLHIKSYKSKLSECKEESNSKKDSILTSLGDLDQILSKLSGKFTLTDIREKKTLAYRKKKMIENEKKKKKKSLIKENKYSKSMINFDYKDYKEKYQLSSQLKKIFPNNKYNHHIDSETQIEISYDKKKLIPLSSSSETINPLLYDDFNRKYNSTKYFKIFNSKKNNNDCKSFFDFSLRFKNIDDNRLYKNNKNRSSDKISSSGFFKQNDIMTIKLRKIYKNKLDKILNEFNYNKVKL